jgi:type I restriction enzyme S subunit
VTSPDSVQLIDARVKHLFREVVELSEDGSERLLSVSEYYGVAPRSEVVDSGDHLSRAESLEGYKKCAPGDLVMNIMLAWKRALGVTQYEGIVSPAYAVFRPNLDKLSSRFAHYFFRSDALVSEFKRFSTGVIDSRLRLYPEVFGGMTVRIPPVDQQERIANFLDEQTARIDALIAEKELLAERLIELRASTISEAVSQEKEFGWRETRLKYLVHDIVDTEHKTVPFYDGGEYLVARTTNIKSGRLTLEGAKFTDAAGYEEWTRRAVPQPGDLLFTREAPAGEACIVPGGIPLCLGQRTVLIRLDKNKADSAFVLWSLYGGLASRFIADLSQGSTVAHFNMPDIGNIPLFTGPLDEQKVCAQKLEVKLQEIDALSAHVDEHIVGLREYRSSLISAAVTGQLDLSTFKAAT